MSETTPEPAEDAPEPDAPQDIVCHGTTALPAFLAAPPDEEDR